MTNIETSSNAQMTNVPSGAFLLSSVFRHSFVIRHLIFVICMALATMSIFAEPAPSARDILTSVRMIEARQQIDLQGQLRENDIVILFRIMPTGPTTLDLISLPDHYAQLHIDQKRHYFDQI